MEENGGKRGRGRGRETSPAVEKGNHKAGAGVAYKMIRSHTNTRNRKFPLRRTKGGLPHHASPSCLLTPHPDPSTSWVLSPSPFSSCVSPIPSHLCILPGSLCLSSKSLPLTFSSPYTCVSCSISICTHFCTVHAMPRCSTKGEGMKTSDSS